MKVIDFIFMTTLLPSERVNDPDSKTGLAEDVDNLDELEELMEDMDDIVSLMEGEEMDFDTSSWDDF